MIQYYGYWSCMSKTMLMSINEEIPICSRSGWRENWNRWGKPWFPANSQKPIRRIYGFWAQVFWVVQVKCLSLWVSWRKWKHPFTTRSGPIYGVCSGFWRHSSLWCVTYLGHKLRLVPSHVVCIIPGTISHDQVVLLPFVGTYSDYSWDIRHVPKLGKLSAPFWLDEGRLAYIWRHPNL